jgi:hypothetical protein
MGQDVGRAQRRPPKPAPRLLSGHLRYAGWFGTGLPYSQLLVSAFALPIKGSANVDIRQLIITMVPRSGIAFHKKLLDTVLG